MTVKEYLGQAYLLDKRIKYYYLPCVAISGVG